MIKKDKAAKTTAKQTGRANMSQASRNALLDQLQFLTEEYGKLESELCRKSPDGLKEEDTERLNSMLEGIEDIEAQL